MENYDINLDNSLQHVVRELSPVSGTGILYSGDYDVVVCESVEDFTSNYLSLSSSALTLIIIGCVFYTCFLHVVRSIIGSLVGGRNK